MKIAAGVAGLILLLAAPVTERYAGVGVAAASLAGAWALIWLSFRRERA